MASDDALTAKLETVSVPLCPRDSVVQVFDMAIIFSILIALWSGLRFYARSIRYSPMNVEDALYYVAVGAFYGMMVALFIALYLGAVGYHMDQLQPTHIRRLTQESKDILVIQALYAISMCAAKWSILWMLKRIFNVPLFRTITWCIIIVQAAWAVMTVLIGFLICRPVVRNWDPTVEGTCGNQIAGYTAVSIYNVTVDIVMCLHPLPVIFQLQVKPPYRYALLAIFSIGIVTVIFSIIRLIYLRRVDFDDFSFSVPSVITWTYAETGVVLLVACSPLLRPVFDKFFRRFLSSVQKSSNKSTGAAGYIHSRSHDSAPSRHHLRNNFVAMDNSDDSIELRHYGHNDAIATTGSTQELTLSAAENHEKGVVVAKTVSQTVERIKA